MNQRYRLPKSGLLEHSAIYRSVELPEVRATGGEQAQVALRHYPWIVVLTQECDLQFDGLARRGMPLKEGAEPVKKHNVLSGILLCPAFLQEHVLAGIYVEEAKKWSGIEKKILLQNRDERYHLLPAGEGLLPESLVLDFKLITSCHPDYLQAWVDEHQDSVVAVLNTPWKERLTQRFVNYFGRVAEPEED